MVEVLLSPVRGGADDDNALAAPEALAEAGGSSEPPGRAGIGTSRRPVLPAAFDGAAPFALPIPYGSTCRPLRPLGLASTPSYEAVPGMSCGGRPCAARQRGAPRPKSGTEMCIGSSPWSCSSSGLRGKSCVVSGTPIWRALVPASWTSVALWAARSAHVAWSMGTNCGIFRGSAGTGSRRLVPMLGTCHGQKPSAPVTLKLWSLAR